MKSNAASLTSTEWTNLFLSTTLLLSLIVRLFPALLAGFPLNDGGMFLVMIRDLRASGFTLPAFTSYNLSNIPFAYPPLGFYLAGILVTLGIPELEVLRWVPIFVSAASIPAFYLLSKALLKDSPRAGVAAMVYALVPGNFAWQIMGGGLTRSLGLLFILLANHAVLKMYQEGRWKYVWLSMLTCSLAVLSHPEVSLATALSCALFWVFFGRTRRGIFQSLVVALGTVILTMPWWGSVIAAHGLAPFQAVLHSGAYTLNPLHGLVLDIFHFDIWRALFNILFLIGIAWNIYRRDFLLPIWLALPYLAEPRSAAAFAYFPESIMAAQVLVDVLPAGLDWLKKRSGNAITHSEFTLRRGHNIALFSLMFLWFTQSALYGLVLANTSLRPPTPQDAMTWAGKHAPLGSKFIILTGSAGIMSDPIQEWFPVFAQRNSRSTLQGLEWTLGDQFFPRLDMLVALQDCKDIQCVERWSDETSLTYSHLLIQKNTQTTPLLESLLSHRGYHLLYENGDYIIFERVASSTS